VWAPGDETIDGLYLKNERQHEAIKDALAAGSTEGARVLAREHVPCIVQPARDDPRTGRRRLAQRRPRLTRAPFGSGRLPMVGPALEDLDLRLGPGAVARHGAVLKAGEDGVGVVR